MKDDAGKQTLAALILLPAEKDSPEARQMMRLMKASLVTTEFAGDIEVWREAGDLVIGGELPEEESLESG